MPTDTDQVIDRPETSRFELVRGDQVLGFSAYRHRDGAIVFTHTVIDPKLEERGLGSELVKGALDQVAATDQRVVAECPFTAAYIAKHPDYQYLLDR